jgi:hypothetical protein
MARSSTADVFAPWVSPGPSRWFPSTSFGSDAESVWDPEEVYKNLYKNGSAKGAKVRFDLRTLCELSCRAFTTSAKLPASSRGLQTTCSPS